MIVLFFTALGVVLLAAETSLFKLTPFWPAVPDLILILMAYFAFRPAFWNGILVVLASSLLLDAVSGIYPGFYTLYSLLFYTLLRLAALRLPIKDALYRIPLTAVCALLVAALTHLSCTLALPGVLPPWSWPWELLRAGLILVLGPLLFGFFDRCMGLLNPRAQRRGARLRAGGQRP